MPVKRPFRRVFLTLGVWGLLLSGILMLGSGIARALPSPQAVEDASLVAIVRPDPKVPNGYRIEEIFSNQEAANPGDLLLLPELRFDIPSEDDSVEPEPEQGMSAEDVPPAKATPSQPQTFPTPPPNAFPEAPLPKSPFPPQTKKSKKKKDAPKQETPKQGTPKQATPSQPNQAAPNGDPSPPPNAFPEAPPASAFPEAPPNAFPEAPPSTTPQLAPLPGVVPPGILLPNPLVPNGNVAPDIPSGPGAPKTLPPGDVPVFPPIAVPFAGASVPESVTDSKLDRRVLVYLWYAPDGLSHYSVTDEGRAYAWVAESSHVDMLRRQARQMLEAQHDWKLAVAKRDPKVRLAALWPFLSGYNGRYNALAQLEYGTMGAVGGNYLAARWTQTNNAARMSLLPNLASFHSPALHRVLITHLKSLQRRYESFLATQKTVTVNRADDWNALPEDMKALYGEIYYGLVGLGGFKDKSDLPTIRNMGRWALKFRFKQANDGVLAAFKSMPAEDNLPIIADTWREYSVLPIPGNELVPSEVIATLRVHRYPATVPLLAVFLRNPNPAVATSARKAMQNIVGRDLGTDPLKWLAWARKQPKTASTATLSKAVVVSSPSVANTTAPISAVVKSNFHTTRRKKRR